MDDAQKEDRNDVRDERVPTAEYGEAGIGPGAQIGHYKLVRILGEGGFGIVYLAEQLEPVRREVALKVIKPGMDTKQVIARFEAERQALALLDHPHIAHVFDAGATSAGHPYFAMEYVTGIPITEYCDRYKLGTRARLELFISLCQAIQYAHQKGIVHRDIKPSNVLVTLQDGKPALKIIDFGVAKALNQHLTAKTLFTEKGEFIGTPEYMSPEQAGTTGLDIDTRADIYSLGVLLYELLTGFTPFDGKELRSKGYAEIQRILSEQDPVKPSTRLTTLGKQVEEVAKSRAATPEQLRKSVRGDLDWIVMKTLEKDRTRRYSTADGLAMDVERYLNYEPVLASPPSAMYRLQKLVQRNRVVIMPALFVLISLAVGTIVSTMSAIGQARAREEADRQSRIAQTTVDFLTEDLLASIDPEKARGREVTVREILDMAAEEVGSRFGHEPVIEASIRMTLGRTYEALGEYPKAVKHLLRAHELCETSLPAEHPTSLRSLGALGWVCFRQGLHEDAAVLLSEALRISTQVLGADNPATLEIMANLASVYVATGGFTEAEQLYLRVVEASESVLGEVHSFTLATKNNLADLYTLVLRDEEAEKLYRETLAQQERIHGADHPKTLMSMNDLGYLLTRHNQWQEAEALYVRALDTSKRVMGTGHTITLNLMGNLAVLYEHEGRYTESEALSRETLEICRRVLGEKHPDTLSAMYNLGCLYAARGHHTDAEVLLLQTAIDREHVLGSWHNDTAQAYLSLKSLYRDWDKPQHAREWAKKLEGRFLYSHYFATQERRKNAIVESQYAIPLANQEIPEELRSCAYNLEQIHMAILRYRGDKGRLPDWLSDLVPVYLDQDTLLCPQNRDSQSPYSPDPHSPCSYSWELSLDPIPAGWDATGRKVYRDWRMRQTKLFGNVVPMVRCTHHGEEKVLSLSMGGQVYWGPLGWESMFKKDYRFGDEDRVPRGSDPNERSSVWAVAAGIVREGVARSMGKDTNDVTAEDYQRIECLDLSNMPISELEPLRGMARLKRLYLHQTQASDLAPLASLTGLRELSLSQTRVSTLEPLTAMTNLKMLWLDDTDAADLGPLRNLTSLEVLHLGRTPVTDLEPLRSLANLRTLHLCGTKVTDLEPLHGLANLETLDIRKSGAGDEQVTRLQNALPKLKIARDADDR
ncbi:MAG: tetratricopeptide repeat protein [Phycisphaerae bacterium]|nr:tetratricopeptide repeat protein [Phycisphaerae bacterium]